MDPLHLDRLQAPSQKHVTSDTRDQLSDVVRQRLEQSCSPQEIDLLYRMAVEGVCPAALARQTGCHRATPIRQFQKIIQRLREDSQLRELALRA